MDRIYPNLQAWHEDGHSLTALAADLGIALSTLSRYKSGDREPDLATALRIIRRVPIPLESLIKPKPKAA